MHNNVEKPTAALVKAVLINGVVDVDGQYHPSEIGPAPPNKVCGFGRVNVKGSLIDKQDPQNKRSGCGQSEEPLNDDDEYSFTIPFPEKVEVDDKPAFAEGEPKQAALGAAPTVSSTPGSPRTLKITLVWSDPPAETLQNDLDLIVEAGGKERHGNMGKKPGFDRQNNVEQVLWTGLPGKEAKVTVRTHRITKGPQHFACAWKILQETSWGLRRCTETPRGGMVYFGSLLAILCRSSLGLIVGYNKFPYCYYYF